MAERTPESGVPLMEKLKRMLPALIGGRGGDTRLPMEMGSGRDPRLPAPSQLESMRESMESVRDLGRPKGDNSLEGLRKAAGVLKR